MSWQTGKWSLQRELNSAIAKHQSEAESIRCVVERQENMITKHRNETKELRGIHTAQVQKLVDRASKIEKDEENLRKPLNVVSSIRPCTILWTFLLYNKTDLFLHLFFQILLFIIYFNEMMSLVILMQRKMIEWFFSNEVLTQFRFKYFELITLLENKFIFI